MKRRIETLLSAVLLGATLLPAEVVAAPPAPATVSPGSPEGLVEVDTSCPTFSWGRVEGAVRYEIAAFGLSTSPTEAEAVTAVLEETLPGSVTTWTPSRDRCFDGGRRYGWTVRAAFADSGVGGAERWTEWAEARLFAVPERPTDDEIRQALSLLETWRDTEASDPDPPGAVSREPRVLRPRAAAGDESGGASRPSAETAATVAVTPDATAVSAHFGPSPDVVFGVHGTSEGTGAGSAGIVGEAKATSGEVHGVVGITDSLQGAAGVFENTAGGDILRGFDGTSQVFEVDQSGVVTATSFVGDGSGLASVDWNQLQSVPAGFADDVDDDTTYQAGTGLALSGNTLRVASLPYLGWSDRLVDSGNKQFPSMVIGVDGLPLISYYDANAGDLKVAHCHDMACTTSTRTTLDSAGIVGLHNSITIGRDGHGVISYYDQTNGDLKLASCHSTACTSATVTTVDSSGDVGQYSSIATDENGYAFIAYYDSGARDLKAVKCNNPSCTSRTIWAVDSAGDVGQFASVTRNFNDYGYISYYDATNGDLKVARCVSMSCASPTINTVDGTGTTGSEEDDVGHYSSITTGTDGLPIIAYGKIFQSGSPGSGASMRVAHCTSPTCSSALVDTMISSSTLNWQGISISRGRDGLAVITACFDTTSRVYFFHCDDVGCTDQNISDSVVTVGAVSSTVTIGADGLPIVAYHTDTDNAVRVVHCSDVSCQPYLRER